jgi:hypothetical protein
METGVRNFTTAFGKFISAFFARWWVAMTFLCGLHLMFGDYFVSGEAVRFILPIAGIACMVAASFLVWKAENDARCTAEAMVYHPLIDIKQSCLCLEQLKREVWSAKIIPSKKVSDVQICFNLSHYSGGVGYNFWTPKRGLILMENVNFTPGVEISVDLMRRDNGTPNPFWRWATKHNGEPVLFTWYRCQLMFLAEHESPDYFDFIVDFHYEEIPPLVRDGKTPTIYENKPSLIGEHRFLYAREWKNDGF